MTKCSKLATALAATVAVSVQSAYSLAASKDVAFMGLKGGDYDINGLNKDGESFFQQLSKVGTAQGFTTENENADTGIMEVEKPDDMLNPYVMELEEETESATESGADATDIYIYGATESPLYHDLCHYENTHDWCPMGWRIPQDSAQVCHQDFKGIKDCYNCCEPQTEYHPCLDDCGIGHLPTGKRFCLDDIENCFDQCCYVDPNWACSNQNSNFVCHGDGFIPENTQGTCRLNALTEEMDCSACCVNEGFLCDDIACVGPYKRNDVHLCFPGANTCQEQCCERDPNYMCKNQPVNMHDMCSQSSVWLDQKWCKNTNGEMDCSVCCSDSVICNNVNAGYECGTGEYINNGNTDECNSFEDCSNCCTNEKIDCKMQDKDDWCGPFEVIPKVHRHCDVINGVIDCSNCCFQEVTTYV